VRWGSEKILKMKLLLVGLPLGNIEDISLRAIRVLKEARLVICEDTRVFRKLWLKLGSLGYLTGEFTGKLEVINEYNEKEKIPDLIEEIRNYEDAILVTDAGMPTISDPGFRLMKRVLELGGKITSAPGPTALTTAMCLSGLSSDRVLFLGFLPKKNSKREKIFKAIKGFDELGLTVAIYEPARSVKKTVKEIKNYFGEVEMVIARELTKRYEEIIRGEMEKTKLKGELVLLWRLSKEKKG